VEKESGMTVCVVGAGRWGKNLVRCFRELGALGAVCDPRAEAREATPKGIPHVNALSDAMAIKTVTAVAIATPAESHFELAHAALLDDRHVFVEKPLCLSTADGETLVRLAKQRDRVLMVGHLLQYHPAVERMKEILLDGELGAVRHIRASRTNLGRFRRSENVLWSFAPHDISLILSLIGEEPDAVNSVAHECIGRGPPDVTSTHLTFPGGESADLFVSWLHPFKEQLLTVICERGVMVFDGVANTLVVYQDLLAWKDGAPAPGTRVGEEVGLPTREPLLAECTHFLGCVKARRRPRTPGEEGLRVLRVLERCSGIGSPAHQAHPSAVIDAGVKIGARTRIWHFSHVLGGSVIGEDCRLGQNVVVGPNVTIGNGVKIQNNVSVYEPRMSELRRTKVGRGATIGANATILPGISIGKYAFIGAGAVVTRDVQMYEQVYGNPARHRGWVCKCGAAVESPRLSCGPCGGGKHAAAE
jgi:UDP-2-acetamido-3-amino-2,3-dideoxy-glucuronate N-acetyltransferase